MLEKPHDGWCHMQLFDVDIVLDADWDDDNPFDWLQACQVGVEKQLPATLIFKSEFREIVMIADNNHTKIWTDDGFDDNKSLLVYDNYNIEHLTEDIFMDINRDFDDWIKEWIVYGFQSSHRQYDDFMYKMSIQGQFFRETEQIEMRLKTALRKMESALLKRKWKRK